MPQMRWYIELDHHSSIVAINDMCMPSAHMPLRLMYRYLSLVCLSLVSVVVSIIYQIVQFGVECSSVTSLRLVNI